MDLGLTKRKALITGATSGIGASAARHLAGEGADLVLAARRREALEETAARIRAETSASIHVVTMDVRDAGSIDSGVAMAAERMGGEIDILVHAAGGSTLTPGFRDRDADSIGLQIHEDGTWTLPRSLESSTDDDWVDLYRLNVISLVRLARNARPFLRRSSAARIIAVSSASALHRPPGQWDYTVAKTAEIAAARCLAAEMREEGILVNAICPGGTDSDASLGLREILSTATGRTLDDITREVWDPLPFHRAASADEVGAVICFLASSRASYITGATIAVDGGLSTSLV